MLMTSDQQGIVAQAIVALAAGWLLWHAFFRRSPGGCVCAECRAISPEAKRLQAGLKRRRREI